MDCLEIHSETTPRQSHAISKARNNLQVNNDSSGPCVCPSQSSLCRQGKPLACPTCCHEPSRLHRYHGDVLSHWGLAVGCQLLRLGVRVHGDTSGQGHRGGDCQQGGVVGGSQAAALLCGQQLLLHLVNEHGVLDLNRGKDRF